MPEMKIPKRYDFDGGDIVEVSYLETTFGIGHRTAISYLKALHIPLMHMPNGVFFNLVSFKRILHVLTRPGMPNFLWPGSRDRGDGSYEKRTRSRAIKEVTDEIVKQALDPKTLVEMAACSGRNPSALGQLVKNPVGRPRKHISSSGTEVNDE